MDIQLYPLSISDGEDIYEMLQEIPKEENGFHNPVNGMTLEGFRTWLIQEAAAARKTELEEGWRVPQSTYWLRADDVPVGLVRIRHFLTDRLREYGGTIGYGIRPSQRGKGYGRMLLSKALDEAWALGIDRALITVQNGNLPSIRAALASGGLITKTTETMHYIWIDLPVR